MKNRIRIIVGIVILAIIGAIAWSFWGGNGLAKQEVSMDEPVDIVLDFYRPWLEAVKSPDTDPYQSGLAATPILSSALRDRLADAENSTSDVDPVLCQSSAPTKIRTLSVYEREDEVQILVLAPKEESTEQAIVTLSKLNEGWYISNIECAPGEFAPEREFSFEMEGFLLKSVPEPYDPEYWHLVFEENGEQGHVVPLLFDTSSMCETTDGKTAVCNPDQFVEPAKAFIQGQMTELGVEVKQIELKE